MISFRLNHTNFSYKGGTYMKKLLMLFLAVGLVMTGCSNASDSDNPDANETVGNDTSGSGGDSDGSSSAGSSS